MPELPEVETVRASLAREVVGRRVLSVEVGRDRVARRTSREQIVRGLTGAVVREVERQGKYLLLNLDSGSIVMVHLRMSGQRRKSLAQLFCKHSVLSKHIILLENLQRGQSSSASQWVSCVGMRMQKAARHAVAVKRVIDIVARHHQGQGQIAAADAFG